MQMPTKSKVAEYITAICILNVGKSKRVASVQVNSCLLKLNTSLVQGEVEVTTNEEDKKVTRFTVHLVSWN